MSENTQTKSKCKEEMKKRIKRNKKEIYRKHRSEIGLHDKD